MFFRIFKLRCQGCRQRWYIVSGVGDLGSW